LIVSRVGAFRTVFKYEQPGGMPEAVQKKKKEEEERRRKKEERRRKKKKEEERRRKKKKEEERRRKKNNNHQPPTTNHQPPTNNHQPTTTNTAHKAHTNKEDKEEKTSGCMRSLANEKRRHKKHPNFILPYCTSNSLALFRIDSIPSLSALSSDSTMFFAIRIKVCS
jgi:hypothetical protein